MSPGKKVQLRDQLVEQLLKWHDLLEKGGINQIQYDEMQATIMEDVKKFGMYSNHNIDPACTH